MVACIFCLSDGPFSTVEHIIPESLGNDDLLLRSEVCDGCQKYFGKEIEQFVLKKTPLAFWRTYLGIKTKRGKNPSVDLSQPAMEKGNLPSVHSQHNNIGFTYHEDGSVSADINDPQIIREILEGDRIDLYLFLHLRYYTCSGDFCARSALNSSVCEIETLQALRI